MTSAALTAFARDLRTLDRDGLYAMWHGALRQAARERELGNRELAALWGSFATVLNCRYEEAESAA